MKKISFIIPCFNNEEQLRSFSTQFEKIAPFLCQTYGYEILFINDKSTDSSWSLITNLAHSSNHIKAVNFSRKLGYDQALCAGYDRASGDVLLITSANLHQVKECLLDMLQQWHNGAEIVYAHSIKNRWIKAFSILSQSRNVPCPFLLDKKVAQKVSIYYKQSIYKKSSFLAGIIPSQNQFFTHWDSLFYTYITAIISKIKPSTLALIGYSSVGSLMTSLLSTMAMTIATGLFKHEFSLYLFVLNALAVLIGLQGILIVTIGHYIHRIKENENNEPLYTLQEFIHKSPSNNSESVAIEHHSNNKQALPL
jgi:glycosyltransferase involved in cell wall biosynthesis